MPLPLISTQPSTTPHNLLKFRHRTYFFINNNKSACFTINTSRKHLGSRNERWIWLIWIYKIIKLFLPNILISSDTHNIARILLAQIRVIINQKLPHRLRFFYICTKDYRFCHASYSMEHFSYASSNNISALHNN